MVTAHSALIGFSVKTCCVSGRCITWLKHDSRRSTSTTVVDAMWMNHACLPCSFGGTERHGKCSARQAFWETGVLTSNDQRAYRLDCIDLVRGLVIVIMALDHVRDYFMFASPAPTSADATPALFATRWITHFCAPVFVLLAGTSAGLMVTRKSKHELTQFLLSRGVWLIIVEWFVISTASTFSPGGLAQLNGEVVVIMQVIWAIGGSMIVLACAQMMGRRVCFAIGTVVLCCHNLLDPNWPETKLLDEGWPLWVSLHSPIAYRVGPFLILFSYPLLPWTGVMLFGFGLAEVFELPANRRNALLLRSGIVLTAIFSRSVR